MRLGIYGAGGMGKETLFLARYVQSITPQWDDIIFIDDFTNEKTIHGAQVLRYEQLSSNLGDIEIVISLGEPKYRKKLYEKLKLDGAKFGKVIYPWSTMLSGVSIGEGCILYGCELSTDVVVKDNTLIDGHVIIGHDTIIGENCYIGANVFIGGHTEVKDCVYIGPGSILKDRILIAEWSILGIGSVVHKGTEREQIIIGNPAKRIGNNKEHRVFQILGE